MRLVVIGLGYVGLPLAVTLSRNYDVVGFERDSTRVAELKAGRDTRNEVSDEELAEVSLAITDDPDDIANADFYFITVPTPVDDAKLPDLTAVRNACRLVGEKMSAGATVILESSVYPGVTEEICIPEIEAISGLKYLRDFHLAHSPERVNPGDGLHSFAKVAKVVGADSPELAEEVANIYRSVIEAPVHVAPNIKVAEFSKILENTQRDMNIALINEAAMICRGLGVSVYDVLEAASTKWNFARYEPGLVGGHCIGVDPYYLVEIGRRHGVDPELIRAARDRNEYMAVWLANEVYAELERRHEGNGYGLTALVLGVTFKENVPDIRNSKSALFIKHLERRGVRVDTYDPIANPEDVRKEYSIQLLSGIKLNAQYDCMIGLVAHSEFKEMKPELMKAHMSPNGFVFDLKKIWTHLPAHPNGPEFINL